MDGLRAEVSAEVGGARESPGSTKLAATADEAGKSALASKKPDWAKQQTARAENADAKAGRSPGKPAEAWRPPSGSIHDAPIPLALTYSSVSEGGLENLW